MPSLSSVIPTLPFLLVSFVLLFYTCSASSNTPSIILKGSSFSVEDDPTILTSLDKTFSCGFYGHLGLNAYWFAIWFTNSKDRTVVWMANRERPVNGRGSKLLFLRSEAILVLRDVDGSVVWKSTETDVLAPVDRAELLDTGNLVLKHLNGTILWQSFDSPTHTLLPNQLFTKHTKLVSSLTRGSFYPGHFSLFFDDNNVLNMLYDGPEISSLYWPYPNIDIYQNGRNNYNSTRVAVLNELGVFDSSDRLTFSAADMGLGVKRRLTLDYDGNLRLYSLNNRTGSWEVSWQALRKPCDVHGICGRNGICMYSPEPKCSCPSGYDVSDPANWNSGCKPLFVRNCSDQYTKYVEFPHVDFYGFDLNYSMEASFNKCKSLCSGDCRCEAFGYHGGKCYTKGALFNGRHSPDLRISLYIKFPFGLDVPPQPTLNGVKPLCVQAETRPEIGFSTYNIASNNMRWEYFYGFAAAIGVIEVLFVATGWWFLFRSGADAYVSGHHTAMYSQFRIFTFDELKKATKNFKEELGRGGSGAVYRGVLSDKRVVAVKKLDNVSEEGFFRAEISTIGRLHHMNLVNMCGFCSEPKHKLLVYEYVENGSLDKHLFFTLSLGWKERYNIALGTAKGLAYLHHECLEWVFHCDVKPQNILLDMDLQPKIADFGLSKLCKRESPNSVFSHVRGTIGYMAPEWALNLPITAKVDVYSYGVVLLEIVKGTRLSKLRGQESECEEVDLMRFVKLVKRNIQLGEESWLDELIDPQLEGSYNRDQAATMLKVGIQCVEEDRNKRPTMDSVVQSLLECEMNINQAYASASTTLVPF